MLKYNMICHLINYSIFYSRYFRYYRFVWIQFHGQPNHIVNRIIFDPWTPFQLWLDHIQMSKRIYKQTSRYKFSNMLFLFSSAQKAEERMIWLRIRFISLYTTVNDSFFFVKFLYYNFLLQLVWLQSLLIANEFDCNCLILIAIERAVQIFSNKQDENPTFQVILNICLISFTTLNGALIAY